MPYVELNYSQPDKSRTHRLNESDAIPASSKGNKSRILFLVHEQQHSIGGVQRHNARLREALDCRYNIERYNWKNPANGLPMNFLSLNLKTARNAYGIIYNDDAVSALVSTRVCQPGINKLAATVHGLDIIASLVGYQSLIRTTLKRLDRIVCVSRATAGEAIKRGADPAKVEIIPNAAEEVGQRVKKDDDLYDKIRSQLGADLRGKKILFSLGRPLRRKGFDKFIKNVFPHLPDDYVYIAAGPKPQIPFWLKSLKKLFGKHAVRNLELALSMDTVHNELVRLSAHPRVFYLNGVSENLRNRLYALADLFIMPNRTVNGDMEGFGIVALEAAVRGVPVIATGIEGITDAVIDGENGYCVPEDDEMSMVNTIVSLAENPERLRLLAGRAREFTLRTFGIETHAEKYGRVFEELLKNG